MPNYDHKCEKCGQIFTLEFEADFCPKCGSEIYERNIEEW